MNTLLIDRPRTNALLTSLVNLHGELSDALYAAARDGNAVEQELADLRLAVLDDLLHEIARKCPDATGWPVYPGAGTTKADATEARQ